MTGTSNLDLKKPTNDEFYDVDVMNENMDIIDGALQSFKDGSVVVGDSKKLDGETSEQWKSRITETGEHRMISIATNGWYRIAKCENASGVKSCDLYIKKTYNTHSNEYYKLCVSQVYNITNIFAEFSRVYGTQIIKKCRYTIEGNTHYLEIQYVTNSSNQITVDIISPITSSEVRWEIIEPILTEETVEGVLVDALYNIPSNVSPITTEDQPSGTYTGNGSAVARAIVVGGTGDTLLVYSDQGIVFVTSLGAYAIGMTKEIVTFAATIANYSNGYLSVATNSKYLNESQRSYKYKVL